jgi:hypothetical protein
MNNGNRVCARPVGQIYYDTFTGKTLEQSAIEIAQRRTVAGEHIEVEVWFEDNQNQKWTLDVTSEVKYTVRGMRPPKAVEDSEDERAAAANH